MCACPRRGDRGAVLGLAYAGLGLGLSAFAVHETRGDVLLEAAGRDDDGPPADGGPGLAAIGVIADRAGAAAAIWVVAAPTAASGVGIAVRMRETRLCARGLVQPLS